MLDAIGTDCEELHPPSKIETHKDIYWIYLRGIKVPPYGAEKVLQETRQAKYR